MLAYSQPGTRLQMQGWIACWGIRMFMNWRYCLFRGIRLSSLSSSTRLRPVSINNSSCFIDGHGRDFIFGDKLYIHLHVHCICLHMLFYALFCRFNFNFCFISDFNCLNNRNNWLADKSFTD